MYFYFTWVDVNCLLW